MLFFIHLLFAITYLSLIYVRHFKLCAVGYPPPRNIKFEFDSGTSIFM